MNNIISGNTDAVKEIIENSIKMHSMHRACTSMSNLNVSQLGMSMGR
ncbi:hypothetical protein [Wolbachia endosymbiont of Chironomus riparius]|nr:hypothetical protein [Wolbachia endosymbiont of Chironomus riparius]